MFAMKASPRLLIALASLARLALAEVSTELAESVFAAIDGNNDGLREVNREIWENPETAYKEVHAHSVLTDYLEEQGFNVTRGAYDIPTAFVAEFSSGEGGRVVSFNSEFDALPGLGHACGHNLIATVGVAAAVGVKEALENQGVSGTVILYGTPAEEGGGGKVRMLDAGAWEGVDCNLMAHPGNNIYGQYSTTLASWAGNVTWHGEASHAAAAPWAGRNAMDGFVAAYQMTSLMRQQLQADDRVHHVVLDGSGQVRNVIPDLAVSQWGVRAASRPRRDVVLDKISHIWKASAEGTNTTVEVVQTQDYWDQRPSYALAESYYGFRQRYFDPALDEATANFTSSDPVTEKENLSGSASSDEGNVSWKVPSIQVGFPIGGEFPVHNAGFRDVAGTDFAHDQAIITAKVLALTGVDVLLNETLADAMWDEFEAWRSQEPA